MLFWDPTSFWLENNSLEFEGALQIKGVGEKLKELLLTESGSIKVRMTLGRVLLIFCSFTYLTDELRWGHYWKTEMYHDAYYLVK